MAYYIRVLTPSEEVIPLARLEAALAHEKVAASLTIEDGSAEAWNQLLLSHKDGGEEIAVIERNPVTPGSLGSDERDEFIESIEGCRPESAAEWLRGYLPRVKTIYAFQILGGTDLRGGWQAVHCLQSALWSLLGGIVQADGEGFSNEASYHILWQFSDHVKGPWWMGVLQEGRWVHFQMDRGNRKQREAFLRGEVPKGAVLA